MTALQQAARWIGQARRMIFLGGAGVSTDVVQKTRKLESNNKRPDYMASFSYKSFGPALTYSLMA